MTDPADHTETLAGQRGADAPADAAVTPPVPRPPGSLPDFAALPAPAVRGAGTVLDGRYVMTERIATGGMASVWRGHDEVLDRTVAIKVLHDHLAADDDFRERFRREAIAAAKLTHPNVVNLYDTGTDGERVYLVMEFVDGATLRDVVSDLGVLEPGQAASIAEKVARALDYAHERGLVHRDVKPANILIGDDGCVKVADFGIAKAEDKADLTKTGMVLGTAAYVAPEQITGADVIDGRADQYALGCMLYEALTGQQPFKADSPVATAAKRLDAAPQPLRAVRPQVPPGLEAVVLRSLERRPDDRFATTGDMADALAAFADSDTSHTAALSLSATTTVARRPPARPRPARRPRGDGRRNRSRLVALLALGFLAIAVGVVVAFDVLDPAPRAGAPNDATTPEAEPGSPVAVVELAAFDPEGDNEENDDQLPALVDASSRTTWRTDIYSNANFGNLKDGVGIVYELQQPSQVAQLRGTTTTPGVNLELYVADEPADDLSGWRRVATAANVGRDVRVEFEPAEAGAVLVWITAPLPPDRRAEFTELAPLGPAG